MLERILGIDASISAIYKNTTINYGAYQNNYSTYDQAKTVRQGASVDNYIQQQTGKRIRREDEDRQAEPY